MMDFFNEIPPGEIDKFRESFQEFMKTGKSESTGTNIANPHVGTRLLDLLLDPEFTDDEDFRQKTCELIGRICELDALDLPGEKAASTDLLSIAFNYKKQLIKHLESRGMDRAKEIIWRSLIQDFFDRFTTELVKRWEGIESERYRVELEEREADERTLRRENARLRGIYALSLEIASISNPQNIYSYLARKLALILPFDVILILDSSDKKTVEHVFSPNPISAQDIETARRKVEDVYELFKREVLDRLRIDVKNHSSAEPGIQREKSGEPESVVIPMIDNDNTWGMIGVFRKAGNPFDPQDVQALSIVTNMVDLVVRNQKAITREKLLVRSLDEQIIFARSVQEHMIPNNYTGDDFTIHTRFRPSKTLSGDFYQFFKTDPGERGVIIGDVTGHGVAAAMMMMTVMGILSEVIALEKTSFVEMLHRANLRLGHMVGDEFFVTALAVWVDSENRFHYFNMGHPPALLISKGSNEITELPPIGFPLGIYEEIEIEPQEIRFQVGDRILLYTDGIIEAKNENGRNFGLAQLKKLFTGITNLDGESALDEILTQVTEYAGADGIHDDIALVLVVKK